MKHYTDLTTFKDACKVEGLNYTLTLIRLFFVRIFASKQSAAYERLVIIIRAANRLANDGKEWIPDYDNLDEYKYEAWFDLSSGGLRFPGCDYWLSFATCGSRLCYISREVCIYIAMTFISEYKDMMTHG